MIAIKRRDRVIPTLFHRVLVPRLSRYGFVELGPTDPWVPIRDTSGVAGVLLTSSGKPAPIPVGEVEKHMADDETLCDLSRETMPCLEVGAIVTIESGAFTGFQSVVLECDGLVTIVEVSIFGRSSPVRLARTMLAAA